MHRRPRSRCGDTTERGVNADQSGRSTRSRARRCWSRARLRRSRPAGKAARLRQTEASTYHERLHASGSVACGRRRPSGRVGAPPAARESHHEPLDPASRLGRGAGALLALVRRDRLRDLQYANILVLRRPRFGSTRRRRWAASSSRRRPSIPGSRVSSTCATGARRWKRDSPWPISRNGRSICSTTSGTPTSPGTCSPTASSGPPIAGCACACCSTTTASSIAIPRSRGCRRIPTSRSAPSTPSATAATAGGTSSPTRRAPTGVPTTSSWSPTTRS